MCIRHLPNIHRIFQHLIRLGLVLVFLSACSPSLPPESANATLVALQVQQTRLAQTQLALLPPTPTTLGMPALEAALSVTDTPQPATPTSPAITQSLQSSTDNEEMLSRRLNAAKILLFEDMSASRHLRYAKEALDRLDYFYLDVGSAKGWFKSQLLSPVEWDLIIASAEARRDFGGEFFEYLDQQAGRGASLVIEYWDWDAAAIGMQQQLLDRCGVEFQDDWFEPDLRVFFWLDPANPILNSPNAIPSALRNATTLWQGDLGDLFRIKNYAGRSESDAKLLAGTYAGQTMDHGVLLTCLQGRMIIQSFSSHEYEKESVIALWQNYIHHTLMGRFAVSSHPVFDASAQSHSDPGLSTGYPTASANLGEEVACGSVLTARVAEPALRQRDLFEHHAAGTFLTLSLGLKHTGDTPVQIWDQDYSLEANVNGEIVQYQPHKAATGYLYITNGGNLVQDVFDPGEGWRVNLAFDIPENSQDWVLVFRPGAEDGQPACEARINLAQ